VRVELAIAYRLFDWLGITDLIHTHISVCVPGEVDAFLQLPYGHLFREARASSMVKCDVEGRVLSDPTGLGISKGGFCIHSALHKGRADAVCVMHAHTEASLAVANYRAGLLPLSQHALRFHGKVGYLEYVGLFDTTEKRARLPQALGAGDVLMLRNHGPLVVGKSIRECFSRMYYLERACRMQVATLSQCRDPASELVIPDEAECRTMARAFEGGDAVIDREWTALVRMIREISPGYDR
jgi:ribulose-5-phosphate 4-epimerase/fuculose-1-phosphate aldolase